MAKITIIKNLKISNDDESVEQLGLTYSIIMFM